MLNFFEVQEIKLEKTKISNFNQVFCWYRLQIFIEMELEGSGLSISLKSIYLIFVQFYTKTTHVQNLSEKIRYLEDKFSIFSPWMTMCKKKNLLQSMSKPNFLIFFF